MAGGTDARGGVAAKGWRLAAATALVLAFLAVRGCEQYGLEFQTLPVVDWIESHPPVATSDALPSSLSLADGFGTLVTDLRPIETARPFTPRFERPGIFVRRIAGVRDAATITVSDLPADALPVQGATTARLSVIVFHRVLRATSWQGLRSVQLDLTRPQAGDGPRQLRTSGPDDEVSVWVTLFETDPNPMGQATVVGRAGAVAYEVQVAVSPESGARCALPELVGPCIASQPTGSAERAFPRAAMAENTARGLATRWRDWLSSVAGVHGS